MEKNGKYIIWENKELSSNDVQYKCDYFYMKKILLSYNKMHDVLVNDFPIDHWLIEGISIWTVNKYWIIGKSILVYYGKNLH